MTNKKFQLRATERFKKAYRGLDEQSQNVIKKVLRILEKNPRHPSLRTKKMGYESIFECSANMDLRITFQFEKPDIIVLRNCGHHDESLTSCGKKSPILAHHHA